MTEREAKEFLVAQIVAEADRRRTALDDVERKMLYFTETAWMPDDVWEANTKFDSDYEQGAYEEKIADLIRSARIHDAASEQQWAQAISALDREDHYLSVMIYYDRLGSVPAKTRPPFDRLKLILTAVLVVSLLMAGIVVYLHFTRW